MYWDLENNLYKPYVIPLLFTFYSHAVAVFCILCVAVRSLVVLHPCNTRRSLRSPDQILLAVAVRSRLKSEGGGGVCEALVSGTLWNYLPLYSPSAATTEDTFDDQSLFLWAASVRSSVACACVCVLQCFLTFYPAEFLSVSCFYCLSFTAAFLWIVCCEAISFLWKVLHK